MAERRNGNEQEKKVHKTLLIPTRKDKENQALEARKEKKLYYVLKNPTSLKHLTCP